MVLAAFAALIPKNVLNLAPRGILNVHPSLLPRWRGAAPIQAALLAGDARTGVSIIRLVQALDAGPILLEEGIPISDDDDYLTLEPRLAALGGQLVVRALAEWPEPSPQDDTAATYSSRIERDAARIDWMRTAQEIWYQVRAYRGWPQAFTTLDGRQLKVLRARPLGALASARPPEPGTAALQGGVPVVSTGDGNLRLDEVQLEGRRAMTGAELARGYPRVDGAKLA
jgi:methionyl-tRNA formyltransferase